MNLSRFFFLCAVVGASRDSSTSSSTEDCYSYLQILHLQDVSGSFGDWLADISGFSSDLMSKLTEAVGEFQYGVAGFVDKPTPYRGWGAYGNSDWPIDYCYMLTAPLSEDPEMVQNGFIMASNNPGSGGDMPENPLEAMIFGALDYEVGWATETHSPSGRPYKKVLLIVTDDLINEPPAAQQGIDQWNAPRQWINETYSTGGWGATNFLASNQIRNLDAESLQMYYELGSLLYLEDQGMIMTEDESTRLQELTRKFGPYPFPDVIPHPGDNSMACIDTDYPTVEQTAKVLKDTGVTPILLLQKAPYANEADYDWTINYYHDKFVQLGFEEPIIGRLGDTATAQTVDDIVELLRRAQTNCLTTTTTSTTDTTTAATTTETTTTSTTTSVETTMVRTTVASTPSSPYQPTSIVPIEPEAPSFSTTVTAEPFTTRPPTTKQTRPTTVEATLTIYDNFTNATTTHNDENSLGTTEGIVDGMTPTSSVQTDVTGEDEKPQNTGEEIYDTPEITEGPHGGNGDKTTTTEGSTAPAGIIAGGGSSAKTIAGAAAGATAGAAAVAAAIWKFGAGMFNTPSTMNLEGIEQMETPDTAVDREAMEEITMDMFN